MCCVKETQTTVSLLVRADEFPARMPCFALRHQIKIQCAEKWGGESCKGKGSTCLICRSEYCVSKSIAMDKEDQAILRVSTNDGLSNNWLSEKQRKTGHLKNLTTVISNY